MNINDAFPSKYLKAGADIPEDETTVVTIKDVVIERLGQGKDAQDKPVIYTKEFDKGFVVNKTNATVIAGLYGGDTDTWEGKQIGLYATDVQGPNGMVLSIRVKNRVPTQRRGPQAQPAPRLETMPAAGPAPVEADEDIPF